MSRFFIVFMYFVTSVRAENSTVTSIATTVPTTVKVDNVTRKDATTQASTKSNSSSIYSSDERTSPVHLVLNPNVREFVPDKDANITCDVLGTNLSKIKPYDLCWHVKSVRKTENITCSKNGSTLKLDYIQMKSVSGYPVFCAITFNRLPANFFWMVNSKLILIKRKERKANRIGAPTNTKNVNATSELNVTNFSELSVGWGSQELPDTFYTKTAFGCTIVSLMMIAIIFTVVFFKLRNRKKRNTELNATNEEISHTTTANENVYSYVPLETVSFYKAKALAASNQKINMESIKPPPLPKRPHTLVEDDDDYIYSYAYGVKVQAQ